MSRDPQKAGQRLHGYRCMSVKPGNCLGVGVWVWAHRSLAHGRHKHMFILQTDLQLITAWKLALESPG